MLWSKGKCRSEKRWSRPKGTKGRPGDPNTKEVMKGKDGSALPAQIDKSAPVAALARVLPISFANMVLNAASLDYLNLDFKSAADRLHWLEKHLAPTAPPLTNVGAVDGKPDLPKRAGDPALLRQYSLCLQRVRALKQQMKLGLSFTGQAENHVTLVALETYRKSLIVEQFPIARSLEEQFQAYGRAQRANATQDARDAVERCKLKEVAAEKEKERAKRVEELAMAQADLLVLQRKRSEAWTEMRSAHTRFKTAVESAARGCDYDRLLKVAAAVTVVVVSGGTATATLAAAGSTFLQDDASPPSNNSPAASEGPPSFPERAKKANLTAEKYRDAFDDVDKLRKAARDLGDAAGGDGVNNGIPELPADNEKILTDAKSFDEALAPFLGSYSEARELDQKIENYTSECLSINAVLYSFDATKAAVEKLDSEIAKANDDMLELQDMRANRADPLSSKIATIMQAYRQDALASVTRELLNFHGVYKYLSLDVSSRLPVSDYNMATLTGALDSMLERCRAARDKAVGRKLTHDRTRIRLADVIGPRGIRQLADNGAVTFYLPENISNFASQCRIYITRVDVDLLVGGVVQSDYEVTTTHHGQSVVFDEKGRRHHFSHDAITTTYRKERGRPVVYSADDPDYVGVSPFGPWTLRLAEREKFKRLTDVHLLMSGFSQSKAPGRLTT